MPSVKTCQNHNKNIYGSVPEVNLLKSRLSEWCVSCDFLW